MLYLKSIIQKQTKTISMGFDFKSNLFFWTNQLRKTFFVPFKNCNSKKINQSPKKL